MTDERKDLPDLDDEELYRLQAMADAEQESSEPDQRDRVRIIGLALILLAGALILLLRGCPVPGDGGLSTGNTRIEAVPGRPPIEGSVSVWVDGRHTLTGVLTKAKIEISGRTDLGKGRYVIEVEPGNEAAAVDALRGTPGVTDAGLVYDGGNLKRTDVEQP